jgi:hypothetical protein
MHETRNRRWAWAAALVVTVVVSASTAAVANHVFPDVAPNSAFHTEVANVVGAGCATGFNDGTFRPLDAPTRQQFAAWMNRCGGRVAAGSSGTAIQSTSGHLNAVFDDDVLAITAGAAPADTSVGGFVWVEGSIIARTNDAGDCPCFVQAAVRDPADDTEGTQAFSTIPTGNTDIGEGFTTIPVSAVFPIDPGETKTFGFRAFFQDANAASVSFQPRLTAIYVPFGPDGDNTLGFES